MSEFVETDTFKVAVGKIEIQSALEGYKTSFDFRFAQRTYR